MKEMNGEEKQKKTFRTEIAFVASLITVIGFLTGIFSLSDILKLVPSPTPEPTHTPLVSVSPTALRPGPHDLDGQDGVASPTNGWLTDYKTKHVEGSDSGNVYLRWAPSRDGREYNRYISEGEIVTVLAMENGFSLVKTSDGQAGWVTSSLLK